MANSLESLSQQLQGLSHTPLTEAEIQRKAQNQYQSAYERETLGARQAYETGELAYDRQLADLEKSYAQQAENTQETTKQSISEADRRALSRGMQRSSYNLATLSNVKLSGDRAVQSLGEAKAQTESDIAAQRTLKAQQLAQTLEQARREYDTNVTAYADKLREQEYQRANEAIRYRNELAMAMYEYQSKLNQQQSAYDRWLAEFSEDVRRYESSQAASHAGAGGSSGGGGGSSSGAVSAGTISGGVRWLQSTAGASTSGTVSSAASAAGIAKAMKSR